MNYNGFWIPYAMKWYFNVKKSSNDRFATISLVTKEEFNDFVTLLQKIKHFHALVFFCKMRQGLSDKIVVVIFNYPPRQTCSYRQSLE